MRVVRGNPGRRPLPEGEPEPASDLPIAPAHLSDEAKAEWDRTGQQLLELGLITTIDRPALAAYCAAWARWVDAEQRLVEFGVVIKSPKGFLVQSPYLSIANRAMEQMMKVLVEFGMTPSSRTRVTTRRLLPGPATKAADPLEEFTS